jgi:acetyltransferase-like isoleucine patch superfamily enzyme
MTLFRAWLNRCRRRLARALLFRMVFGERTAPHSRISPSTCIEHERRLTLGDHVFIGAFNFIEASGGITLGEGVQITNFCSLVTHSSQRSQRLLGRAYAQWQGDMPGFKRAPIAIGAYTFVGPHSLIEAGSRIGKGVLVCAYSQVRGEVPDFAIVAGQPAQVVGDTRQMDARLLNEHPELRAHYEAWAGRPPEPLA